VMNTAAEIVINAKAAELSRSDRHGVAKMLLRWRCHTPRTMSPLRDERNTSQSPRFLMEPWQVNRRAKENTYLGSLLPLLQWYGPGHEQRRIRIDRVK
jgi:hypothetical protein